MNPEDENHQNPDHVEPEQDYHPDPKSADTIHDSGTELTNIVEQAATTESADKGANEERLFSSGLTEVATESERPSPVKTGARNASRGKKVLLVCLIIVLLCGIGALVFFLVWRNTPEVVVMDAVVNYLNTDTVRTGGYFTTEIDNYMFTGKATFTFNGEAHGLNHKMAGTLKITSDEQNIDLTLTMQEVFTEDGELYFKIDKIRESLEAIGSQLGDATQILKSFSDTIELSDGTWFRVSVPELLNDFKDEISASDRRKYSKAYSCVIDALKSPDTTQLIDFYKEHPFIIITSYKGNGFKANNGGNLYELDLKIGQLQKFLSSDFASLPVYEDITNCLEDFGFEFDINQALRGFSKQLDGVETAITGDNHLVVEIDYWTHRLLSVQTSGKVEEYENKLDFSSNLSLEYPKSIDASAPSDAKPVSTLINSVMTDLDNAFSYSYDYDYDYNNCGSSVDCIDYDDIYYDKCRFDNDSKCAR